MCEICMYVCMCNALNVIVAKKKGGGGEASTGLQNNCINENKLPNKINAAVSTNSEIPRHMLKIIGKRASAPFS